jgi:hypothetical protein
MELKSLIDIYTKYASKKRFILKKIIKKKAKNDNLKNYLIKASGTSPEILRRFTPQDDSFALIFKELKEITKKLEQLNKKIEKNNKK